MNQPNRFAWIASLCVFVSLIIPSAFVRAETLDFLPKTIGGVDVVVPEPSLPDGLDATAEAEVLSKVAGKYSLDRFAKDSIVAPFVLQRTTIKDAEGKRVGHQIDVWFVAYGQLEAIRDEEMFRAMVQAQDSDAEGDGRALTEGDLKSRGIDFGPDDESSTAYYRFSAPVLDRVVVSGVARVDAKVAAESYTASVLLEPKFDDDDVYPNRWRHAAADQGNGFAYSGFGGFAKATKLQTIEGALLIECHAVMHEPEDWFGGANLLGSKLPLAAQDAVRRFRRSLAKHSQ